MEHNNRKHIRFTAIFNITHPLKYFKTAASIYHPISGTQPRSRVLVMISNISYLLTTSSGLFTTSYRYWNATSQSQGIIYVTIFSAFSNAIFSIVLFFFSSFKKILHISPIEALRFVGFRFLRTSIVLQVFFFFLYLYVYIVFSLWSASSCTLNT